MILIHEFEYLNLIPLIHAKTHAVNLDQSQRVFGFCDGEIIRYHKEHQRVDKSSCLLEEAS